MTIAMEKSLAISLVEYLEDENEVAENLIKIIDEEMSLRRSRMMKIFVEGCSMSTAEK